MQIFTRFVPTCLAMFCCRRCRWSDVHSLSVWRRLTCMCLCKSRPLLWTNTCQVKLAPLILRHSWCTGTRHWSCVTADVQVHVTDRASQLMHRYTSLIVRHSSCAGTCPHYFKDSNNIIVSSFERTGILRCFPRVIFPLFCIAGVNTQRKHGA